MVYSLWRNKWKKTVSLNTVILPKVKVKSINGVALPDRAQNNSRGGKIRFSDVYVCDDAHDEILGTIFPREELNYDAFILEGEI